jgi:hypothetical protein
MTEEEEQVTNKARVTHVALIDGKGAQYEQNAILGRRPAQASTNIF